GNYAITDQTSASADIARKAVTVTGITVAGKTYDGTTNAAINTAGAAASFVAGDAVTVTTNGAFADKNAGAGKAVALSTTYGGADAGNYAITDQASASADIARKAVTVTGITVAGKTYDGTTGAAINTAGAAASFVAGDAVTVTANGAFADKNAGAGKAVALTSTYGGADVGNYAITDQTSASADIARKAVTVTGITVAGKTYDGTTNAAINTAGAAASFVAGDAVTVTTNGAFADKNAGAGKTVALTSTYGGADVGNYVITDQASTTATVARRSIGVVGTVAADKVFDGNTNALASGGTLQGVLGTDAVQLQQTGAFLDPLVGTGKSVGVANALTGADAGNYQVGPSSATASIVSNDAALAASQTALAANGGTRSTLQANTVDGSAGDALLAGHQNGVANVVAAGAGATLGGYVLAALTPDAFAPVVTPDNAIANADLNSLPPTAAGLLPVDNQIALAEPMTAAGAAVPAPAVAPTVAATVAPAAASGRRGALGVNNTAPAAAQIAGTGTASADAGSHLQLAQAGSTDAGTGGQAVNRRSSTGRSGARTSSTPTVQLGAGVEQNLARAASELAQAPVIVADAGNTAGGNTVAGSVGANGNLAAGAEASASGAGVVAGIAAAASAGTVPVLSQASAPSDAPANAPISKTLVVLGTLSTLAAGLTLGKRLFGRKPDA
ncbi:MAG: hypothetical protein RIQ60_4356, partial [Pseudomonadota bacterium]